MAALSLTAYAARRGVSPKAVSKAVAAGRLTASVVRDERGVPAIADPDLADREWEANTRQRPSRLPSRPAATAAGVEASPAASDRSLVSAAPGTSRHAGLPVGIPSYNVSQAVRAASAARREAAQADLAELELAAKRGRLVDADQARADVFARISMAKTRLLGVPTLVAQDAPELAARVVPLVERRIREALEELSLDDRGA